MDQLSATFSALADPTRRAILSQLSKGELNVSELAEPFLNSMSLPAITKHLKVLEKAGLITKTKHAQYRSCQINTEPISEATMWMDQCREVWEESFDRLDEYLLTLQEKKKTKRGKSNGKIKK